MEFSEGVQLIGCAVHERDTVGLASFDVLSNRISCFVMAERSSRDFFNTSHYLSLHFQEVLIYPSNTGQAFQATLNSLYLPYLENSFVQLKSLSAAEFTKASAISLMLSLRFPAEAHSLTLMSDEQKMNHIQAVVDIN